MTAIPGIVFRKLAPAGFVTFGIDFGINNVRFWHMNKYIDFAVAPAPIPNYDNSWHFLSATFVRYDIKSLTNVYAQVD
jgi:hypothetical protein